MPDNKAAYQQLQQRIEDLEEELSCPITLQPMEDPVLLVASGETFSRASIEEHWQRGHTRWMLLSDQCPNASFCSCPRLRFSAVAMVRRNAHVVHVRRCPVTNIAIGDNLTLSPNIVVRRQVDGLLRLKAQLAEKIKVRLPAAVLLRLRHPVLRASLEAHARAGAAKRQGFSNYAIPEPANVPAFCPDQARVHKCTAQIWCKACKMALYPH